LISLLWDSYFLGINFKSSKMLPIFKIFEALEPGEPQDFLEKFCGVKIVKS